MAEKAHKNNKIKPSYVNNIACLRNIVRQSNNQADIYVFGDNLQESEMMIKSYVAENKLRYIKTLNHGNSATFLETLDFALDHFENDDIVYFVEDDYIHRFDFPKIIKEGLKLFNYIS